MATSVRARVCVYTNNNGQTYGDHQEQPHILLPREYLIRFYTNVFAPCVCRRTYICVCVFSSEYTVNI